MLEKLYDVVTILDLFIRVYVVAFMADAGMKKPTFKDAVAHYIIAAIIGAAIFLQCWRMP